MNCPKALYLDKYQRELRRELTEYEQKLLNDGNQVGEAARNHFKGGYLVDEKDPIKALEQTKQAVAEGHLILFEAAVLYDDVLIRADVLKRESESGPWSLYEVKATTMNKCSKDQLKEYQVDMI